MMEDWAERKPSLVFECEDISETYESMAARGVEFSQEPKDIPWGKIRHLLGPGWKLVRFAGESEVKFTIGVETTIFNINVNDS